MTMLKVMRDGKWVNAEVDDLFYEAGSIPLRLPPSADAGGRMFSTAVNAPVYICYLCGTLVPEHERERHLAFHTKAPYPMYVEVKDAPDGT